MRYFSAYMPFEVNIYAACVPILSVFALGRFRKKPFRLTFCHVGHGER